MDVILCQKLFQNCSDYLNEYRINGLNRALVDAKELAAELGIEAQFKE